MWYEGGEAVNKKKAMWLYPKVSGFSPSERWGHSACFSNGNLYVFGGCCGGLHFSDVLVLNVETMAWRALETTGQGPGPRDSHSSVLVGHRMIVFGGTNGSKKVNDLHILDLKTREWTQPEVRGKPPFPRESHTATLAGNDKIVIFGGSGEGDGNYLNDLHILDLKTMRWTSPDTKGQIPVPRDSHSAVSINNKLLVYGGDCGDRYHGDVDVLDMDTMTWSKVGLQGLSPGVRAGHGAVSIGTKVYVIGGVGDKHYYSDVWVLDLTTCTWNRLDSRGQQPQGRFSHTAVVVGSDIAIYGGCGEDERPLNEVLVLQLREDSLDGRDVSLCGAVGKHWNRESAISPMNDVLCEKNEVPRKAALGHCVSPDALQLKRRRIAGSSTWDVESDQEEHSLSLSQNSSPSLSDPEQTPVTKAAEPAKGLAGFHFLKQLNQSRGNEPSSFNASNGQKEFRKCVRRTPPGLRCDPKQMHPEMLPVQNLIGADVCGKVDGAFDSGYLVTASVNGRIFRGVLFAPGPASISRGAVPVRHPSHHVPQIPAPHSFPNPSPVNPFIKRSSEVMSPERGQISSSRPARAVMEPKHRNDLQGVVLTLGGPGSGID
ncbi:hypothetical protein CDL15_Pgr018311 [Punica granatum]|uniref:Rab9 effector protein with kelch motifs-like n=1 Tax=Punica granatum TaxID=22663 RepID=A0A218WID0_PUNGR|nr:hypothetical protein CDL15_Pgr018311 [Punica granatum]